MKYKFSAPMPYNIEDIDKILNINNLVEKSAITSMYACVPRGCELFTGFEQARNSGLKNTSWDYWKNLIEYTMIKGNDFIYLLNSPRLLDIENPDFSKKLEKLDLLLTEFRKIGVKKLRISSGKLMTYITKHYSDFEILASTSFEYKTICEYKNFIEDHPEIKQIVPSYDINKNFKILSILRKYYPDIELEIMVNQGCLKGCPNRMAHQQYTYQDESKLLTDNNKCECLSLKHMVSFCNDTVFKYPILGLLFCDHIFPWEIEEYVKLGITNFKLVGRENFGNSNHFEKSLESYILYLKGIDNIKSVENCSINDFSNHLMFAANILDQITVKDYKKYLPNIKYFVKYGHLCSSRCGWECRYCYKCAEKIQKVFIKKQKAEKKRTVPACVVLD